MVAGTVIPPSPLQRLGLQGDTLFPRRGLRPLHPAWGTEEARPNPLPSLPPNTGARTDILSPDYRVWSTHMCHAYRGGVRRLESCEPVS